MEVERDCGLPTKKNTVLGLTAKSIRCLPKHLLGVQLNAGLLSGGDESGVNSAKVN